MLKKIFSHTIIYALAPQISKIASFFILPIITRDLTEIDYGVFGILTAYTTAIGVFAALGLKVVLVNSYFKSPGQYKWAWRQIYGFLTLWNFVYALLLAVLIYFVVPKEAVENRWIIILLNIGPLVIFGQTATISFLFYQIKQKPLPIAIRTAIFGLLTVFLNLYFISHLKMGYMGWFYSIFIVGIISNISYWYPLNIKHKIKPIFNYKWRLIKKSLNVSLPTIPHFYSNYLLNSSDRIVLDLLKVNTGSIGKYNIAYMFGSLIENIGMAFGMAASPVMMKYYRSNNDIAARNLVFLGQAVFFTGTFLMCLWMKEIFCFLIRNDVLNQMYYLAIIIVMSFNYRPMYLGAVNKLFFTENTKVLWKISFIAGISNIILNLIFIPILGFEFAAVSTFIAFMYMGYSGFYLKIYKKINTVNFYPHVWLSATVVLTLIAYFSVEFNVYIKAIISAFLLFLGIALIRKYKKYFA